jgi:steroid Delta-isomerase
MAADPRVERIVALFEQLAPADLPRLQLFYAADARFKDPFNDVQGVPAIERVFAHMFDALDEPRFVVHEALADGDQCFLTWEFRFRFKGRAQPLQTVRGATHLRWDAQGRIELHRDYWDAAEELYEKLPLLGPAMRWLRRRAAS